MDNIVLLHELFHRRAFQIPDYQRGYSWETLQIREFLEDLEILGPKVLHYTVPSYFIRSNPNHIGWMKTGIITSPSPL